MKLNLTLSIYKPNAFKVFKLPQHFNASKSQSTINKFDLGCCLLLGLLDVVCLHSVRVLDVLHLALRCSVSSVRFRYDIPSCNKMQQSIARRHRPIIYQ